MHAVNLYIDENLNEKNFLELKNELMMDSHVANVAYHAKMPHDMLVEYDKAFVSPTSIVGHLEAQGLHVDVTGG